LHLDHGLDVIFLPFELVLDPSDDLFSPLLLLFADPSLIVAVYPCLPFNNPYDLPFVVLLSVIDVFENPLELLLATVTSSEFLIEPPDDLSELPLLRPLSVNYSRSQLLIFNS
jgi:hypothetical protein